METKRQQNKQTHKHTIKQTKHIYSKQQQQQTTKTRKTTQTNNNT